MTPSSWQRRLHGAHQLHQPQALLKQMVALQGKHHTKVTCKYEPVFQASCTCCLPSDLPCCTVVRHEHTVLAGQHLSAT